MGFSSIANAPVSHGVEPHDLETDPGLRLRLQPMARSPGRSPLLPRERFSPWAESGQSIRSGERVVWAFLGLRTIMPPPNAGVDFARNQFAEAKQLLFWP